MKLGLDMKLGLTQQLTPQQIQYLKLLQMPIIQLEQQVRQEIELNPMLEDPDDYELLGLDDDYPVSADPSPESRSFDDADGYDDYGSYEQEKLSPNFELEQAKLNIDDKPELFEFHKQIMDSGDGGSKGTYNDHDDNEYEPFQIKDNGNFIDDLFQQLRQYPLTEEELILGEQIIGNIDPDGYLRRDMKELVDETNEIILELNMRGMNKLNGYTNGNGHANGNGHSNGNGHTNGNGHYTNGNGNGYSNGNGHANGNGHYTNGNGNGYSNGHTNGNGAYTNGNGNGYTNGNGTYTNGAIKHEEGYNPAKALAVSPDSIKVLNKVTKQEEAVFEVDVNLTKELAANTPEVEAITPFKFVTVKMAEEVLRYIQKLDPPGIGARSIQECLTSQLKAVQKPNAAQALALEMLNFHYDAFIKKHYQVITKQLEVSDEFLKEALEVIKRLNPKPGGGDFQAEINTVTPDFLIEIDEEKDDLIITVNESTIPKVQVSKAYDGIRKEAKYKLYNKETKDWIRSKFEDAKFMIQALRQRKNTMTKVMTAIAQIQKDFFFFGQSGLKPLIYKDISEVTGLDISTVCRIVNGKYVQTDFGTFELKSFFSESLSNDEGEEISTTVIKNILKDIIAAEDKQKPLSDDDLSKALKDKGYNVARRTVAKYREQLRLPVARLRREI